MNNMKQNTPFSDIRAALEYMGCKVEPCGSRVTCDPPPLDTDMDYLVEIIVSTENREQKITNIVNALQGFCLEWEGSEHYQHMIATDFMSWRRGEINLIVTSNFLFAERHRVATALCKRFNLMNKPDRIALFQGVLYGQEYDASRDKVKAERNDMPVDDEPVF